MDVYEKLKSLGLTLPEPPPLGGLYAPVKRTGNLLFCSGQGPTLKGIPLFTGKVGSDLTVEEGQAAAKACTLNVLSILHAYTGDLNRIVSVVKILVFVSSAPGFFQQPLVANGASQLFIDLFGEAGRPARSAVGHNELPGNIPVEVEGVFEVT
ncbi:MAG: RidA family protein [Spirochaetaceae bacterium]|jgi:enamine deaminase RidA (YjgF/YER057c/UK114 family)|nr:RidA family protein [Spirochaetaceae bacterium]